jgi:hypothetical protein
MRRDHLVSNAMPALEPLFEAYSARSDRNNRWFEDAAKRSKSEFLRKILPSIRYVTLFSIAQAIAIISDNVSRVYCLDKLDDEMARKKFGMDIQPGFPFGKALWLAGNTARHYSGEPFSSDTESALVDLGIAERREGTTLEVLIKGGVTTLDEMVSRLNTILDDVEAEAWKRVEDNERV